jgi:hypothetical protein
VSDERTWELRRIIVAALRREYGFMGAVDILGEFEDRLLRPVAESGVGAGVTNLSPEPQS